MKKPTLVYDGFCKFCIQNVELLERLLKKSFDKKSFRDQSTLIEHPELSLLECEKEMVLLLPDGSKYLGAEAVAKLFSLHKHLRWVESIYRIEPVKLLCDWLYRNISKYRFHLRYWK